MNATDSGMSVLRIHMQCGWTSVKTNSMPAFCGIDGRHMSPLPRSGVFAATSAWMRCMPALSSMRVGR